MKNVTFGEKNRIKTLILYYKKQEKILKVTSDPRWSLKLWDYITDITINKQRFVYEFPVYTHSPLN